MLILTIALLIVVIAVCLFVILSRAFDYWMDREISTENTVMVDFNEAFTQLENIFVEFVLGDVKYMNPGGHPTFLKYADDGSTIAIDILKYGYNIRLYRRESMNITPSLEQYRYIKFVQSGKYTRYIKRKLKDIVLMDDTSREINKYIF